MPISSLETNVIQKPFLRWAGGKTWLLKHLSNLTSNKYANYHEPFLGGAAVFFYLKPQSQSYLSDLNEDLIETYLAIKKDAPAVVKTLRTFKNSEREYYDIRERDYKSNIKRAAKFIYLNQTSYNGIYRVNLNGIYNVPFGFRKKEFLDIKCLLSAQKALKNATIFKKDFSGVTTKIKKGDLIFLDPPYTVSHNNNGFIKYNEKLFSMDDQVRLSEYIDKIKSRKAFYILTNAAYKKIEDIFEKGDRKLILERSNCVGGIYSKRGITSEFVFTNLPPQ
jgi:DNA adenine methylase